MVHAVEQWLSAKVVKDKGRPGTQQFAKVSKQLPISSESSREKHIKNFLSDWSKDAYFA